MRAMILAAGLGTRLRPLTETTPKAMVKVAGRPLIAYALDAVREAGIREVVVNLHYLGDILRDYLGDGSAFGVSIAYSSEDPIQDSGGGIRDARALLGEETFITLNADTIVSFDLAPALEFHRRNKATATLLLRTDPGQAKFGLIRIDRTGRIGAFLQHQRPGAGEALEPYMYTGVQILEPRVFDYMETDGPFSITRHTYPLMLASGEPLFGWPSQGRWITVGTPDELRHAEELLVSFSNDASRHQ
ncbi:MAG: mannose-1-phosphate guanylyltransferase/phosphomannomutase [Hyphomicrobiaceae bacterium]|jgi:mannose-1-phosphate guanylyltransferase/phosphomannomutase